MSENSEDPDQTPRSEESDLIGLVNSGLSVRTLRVIKVTIMLLIMFMQANNEIKL